MENETEHGDSREQEIKELRDDATLLEVEALDLVAGAAALDVEADNLEEEGHETHFKVDGEAFKTNERILKANQILRIADLDPALRYLEEISPEKKSFKDNGEEEIRIINHMEFISLRVGPTPVS